MQQEYGLGPATSVHVVGPAITGPLTNDQMIAYIQNVIASGGPARDGKTFYMLYLPDGSGNAARSRSRPITRRSRTAAPMRGASSPACSSTAAARPSSRR